MNGMNERHGAADADAAANSAFEFVVDGATISVAFSGDASRDPHSSLEKAKRAIARLASLQEAELGRQKLARQKQPGIREMPNVFDYWAYRRD